MSTTSARKASRLRLVRQLAALVHVAILTSMGAPAGAVIIDSGDGSGNTSAPPDVPGWDYVGLRSVFTAVYLGNGWVASAHHVPEGGVILDGVLYPAVVGSKLRIGVADLAVFQIDPAPAWPLLPISSAADITGEAVTMIGQGRDRGASTSACAPPPIAGYRWEPTIRKRWGENVVTGYDNVASTDAFYTTFDENGGLTHEAQAANGDSGGAVFVKNAGEWELAGILFSIGSFACQPLESAFYGNLTYASDLSAYRDQILPIVRPECSDELDNDGDLRVDHPDDPDCNSALDDREKSPRVPSSSSSGLALLVGLVLASGLAAQLSLRR